MIKKSDIVAQLVGMNIPVEDNCIVLATVFKSYYALSFHDQGVVIMPITAMGNLSGEVTNINKNEIENLEVSKKLLGYNVKIQLTNGEKHKYVVRPIMVGFKDQKQGVELLVKKYKTK